MQDQYTGIAGTFVIDPDKGVRVPIEQYQAEQSEKQTQKPVMSKVEVPLKATEESK